MDEYDVDLRIKNYLTKNLRIEWEYSNDNLYIVLNLAGKTISRIRFERE